jgi:ligand-binding sensor domain-containing protein
MSHSSSGALTVISKYNKAAGFPTDNVKVISEDRDGNIWSGNYGDGLTQITAKIYTVYTFDKVIYGKSVFSVFADKQFRWIGTEYGLLKLEQTTGKIVKFYSRGSGLPKDIVTAIYSTDGKELWIGTEENGVFRMNTDHEKISRYPIGNGELENSVTAITGNKEQVWIGTKKGLCNIHSGSGTIKWYSISQGGLPHNFINCLHVDRSGRLWISSHSNTLAYIREEKVYKLPISSVNGTLTLGPIAEDADSRIWVGSSGNP